MTSPGENISEVPPSFIQLDASSESRHAAMWYIGVQDSSGWNGIWPGNCVLKRLGSGRGLLVREADAFVANTRLYHERLALSHWAVPKLIELRTHPTASECEIWLFEEYIAGDRLNSLAGSRRWSPEQFLGICARVIEDVAQIPIVGTCQFTPALTLGCTSYGIDLKPSNLVVRSDGKPVLVDQFPPLLTTQSGLHPDCYNSKLHSFSQEKLALLCCTKPGMIMRFLRLVTWDLAKIDFRDPVDATSEFADIVARSSLETGDKALIGRQLTSDFPWLRRYYPSGLGTPMSA